MLSLLWKSLNVCCEKGPSVNIIHFCAVHLCAPDIKTHQLWWHTFISSEFWDHRIYLYVWEKMTIWLEDTEHTVWMDSREVDYAAVIGQKVLELECHSLSGARMILYLWNVVWSDSFLMHSIQWQNRGDCIQTSAKEKCVNVRLPFLFKLRV